MTAPAIRVEGLWKEYLIGQHERAGMTFRETINDLVGAPLKRLSRTARAEQEKANQFWALRDVSFDVQPGEVVGVIGRNGAGKSTLLKILSRITAPTRGRIEIRGRIASLLEVGTGFHPELSGRENIRLNGAILGMSGAEIARKFDEIVDFAGVEKFIDTPVKRYSSGMHTRLAFSVAAHLDPEILIIDEVLAVGDAEFQKKCLRQMSQLSGSGRTILFVSHNLGAIKMLCKSALYLQQGRLMQAGPVDQVAALYIADTAARRERSDILDKLSSEIDLEHVSLGSGSIESYSRVPFEISVRASRPTTLLDLAILIEHEDGERAATIDCRDATFPRILQPGDAVTVAGEVESLNLVEGNYSLAVYQRTHDNLSITRDVVEILITETMADQLHAPYYARDRGSAALKLRFANDSRTIIS